VDGLFVIPRNLKRLIMTRLATRRLEFVGQTHIYHNEK
jgi:hypothetical protein